MRVPLMVLVMMLSAAAGASAETLQRSTEYSSPSGLYRDVTALNSLTVGIAPTGAGVPANAATGSLTLYGDLASANGNTVIEERLIADGDTLRVLPYNYWGGLHWTNIGFNSPESYPIERLADLNINGDIFARRGYNVAPRFSERALFLGTTDPATPPVHGYIANRDDFNAWQPVYIKANIKLVLNSGAPGRSSGNVLIGASPTDAGWNAANNAYKLFVNGSIAAAGLDVTSSREAKTALTLQSPEQHRARLDRIETLPYYTYRYKTDDPQAPLRIGPIAEESPKEVLNASGDRVSLQDLLAYLWSAIIAASERNDQLRERITALESRAGEAGV
ncbi:MAG: hypothetical protein MOGMAGMI_00972 [Candidatus Omnitrophica bacterium]|nr:hypothetical protein [Candidatus Omnitrophota bacterium]